MTMYSLKTDLSKRRFTQLVSDFLPSDIELSKPSYCNFSRRRGAYWLSWSGFEVSFMVFYGQARFRIKEQVWPEDGEAYWIDRGTVIVPFEYLQDHDFLKEVA